MGYLHTNWLSLFRFCRVNCSALDFEFLYGDKLYMPSADRKAEISKHSQRRAKQTCCETKAARSKKMEMSITAKPTKVLYLVSICPG